MRIARLAAGMLAVGLLASALHLHLVARDAASWPSVVGTLDARGIVAWGAGSDGGAVISRDVATYARYTYRVGDKTFTGRNVRLWDMPFGESVVHTPSLGQPTANANVLVFYDPASPETAVLDITYPIAPVLFYLLSAVITGFFAVFAKPLYRMVVSWFLSTRNLAL